MCFFYSRMIQWWWTIWASACCLIVAKANDCSYIEEIGDQVLVRIVSIGPTCRLWNVMPCQEHHKFLVYRNMTDNKIEKMDKHLFQKTPELRQLFVFSSFLFVYNNFFNLKKIPIDVFEQLTSLLQVNLYDNGIQCRCSLWNSTVWAKEKCVSLSLNCKGINSVSYWNLESYYENRCGPNRKLKKRRKYIFNHPAYHKRRNHHDFSSPYDYPDFDTKPMYIDEDYIYDDTDTNETLSLDVSKSYCQIRKCRFSTYLDRMDCEGNNIEIFQSNSYPFPERMFTELVLDDNKLKTLEANAFDQLRELMIISLRKNLLSNLDPDVFKSLKNLIYLDLSENQLGGSFDSNMFSNQNNLQVVYINNNNVQSIDVELFRRVTSLKRLFLWENPLNCNCELRPIVKMVLKRKVLNQGRCRYPPLYDGELWDILKGASYCRLPLVYTQYKPAKADATTVVIIIVGVMVLIGCIMQIIHYLVKKYAVAKPGEFDIPSDIELF
ncbi:hypothetical protein L9F63_019946 [Diploptera punctata]|uniref:LRRCT domain-containing protein n=1 Tax=Diploptera punctata TaxID=6984 RepID=A0AAD7ZU04_DIPPU|nr:hypothetical protein L9F63_019946 [Diploptera punctata]